MFLSDVGTNVAVTGEIAARAELRAAISGGLRCCHCIDVGLKPMTAQNGTC